MLDSCPCHPSFRVIVPIFWLASVLFWQSAFFFGCRPRFSTVEARRCTRLPRCTPLRDITGVGFDENLYRAYVNGVIEEGLWNYPDIVDRYIEVQKTLAGSILPPMRFLYIFFAYAWHQVFGTEALAALRDVASFFSILSLLLATAFAWRLKGPACAFGVAAMVAFAPTQLHMSQHALVDGFFAFWALFTLWMLWESLREPRKWRWLLPYLLGLSLMVITKENAAFVYFAILVLIAANHWLKWGTVTRELLACTFIGPLLGFVILVFLAGAWRRCALPTSSRSARIISSPTRS